MSNINFLDKRNFLTVILLFIMSTFALGQTSIIQGTVLDDSNGEPLVGATVQILGTTQGALTGPDGRFSIEGGPAEGTLSVSLIGYDKGSISFNEKEKSNLIIRLSATIESLNQVVVVGFGSLKQREVSSAITHIGSDDLTSVASSNALESISGKISGLNIQNSFNGDPNSTPSIQLRGVSSRSAGLGPLIVIDGIVGGNLENLNQDDIESIDVLKGGAASAIYGTRGSNGVIIVTTKSGKPGFNVSYDGYLRFNVPTRILYGLSAEDFLSHDRGPDFGDNTNWMKEAMRNYSIDQNHNVQFSGGSEFSNYFVSLFYRDGKGIDLASSKTEYGARATVNHRSQNNLFKLNFTAAPRFVDANLVDHGSYNGYSSAISANPTMPLMDPDKPNSFYNIRTGFFNVKNPVEDMITNKNGNRSFLLDISSSLQVNLLENLFTKITLSDSYQDIFGFNFAPSYNTTIINGNGGRNTAGRNYDRNDLKNFEWIGNYTLNVDEQEFKVLGGYSYSFNRLSGLGGTNQNFPFDALMYNSLQDGSWNLNDGQNGTSSYQESSKLIAFFGRLNYNFRQKYYLSASLRREGSSKFGSAQKWGNFPAVSLGWIISDESFLKNVSWIDNIKLRADYGETGNQDFGNYLSLAAYSGYGYYRYMGNYLQVWGPSVNPNPFLHWEKALNFNIGADFSLFSNRLNGSLNYYVRTNKDLLGDYDVPLPPNVQSTIFANVGTMRNSGIEISLDFDAVRKKDFNYKVSFIGASNSNKFVSFSNKEFQGQGFLNVVNMPAPNSPGLAQRLQEGKRIGSFYMLKSAGVDESGELQVYDTQGNIIPATDALADDRTFVGNGLPKFTASLNNAFKYKNWDLSIFLRGAFGYDLFNTLAFYLGTPGTQTGANILSDAYDSNNKYSKLTSLNTYTMLSDYYLESGDFVKIDNITLGFTIDKISNVVKSMRIYATGRNLVTFTKWQGGDPEAVNVNGLYPGINNTISYFPSTLQLILGLHLNF